MKIFTPIKAFILIALLSSNEPVSAQNEGEFREISEGWFELTDASEIVPESFYKSDQISILGLNPSTDSYQLVKKKNDNLGFTHYRLQQVYKGYQVEGGELLLHSKNNRLQTLNGEIVKGLNGQSQPALTPVQAVKKAEKHIGADLYLHDDPETKAHFHKIFGEKAPGQLSPKLVWTDKNYSNEGGNYRLAYKIDVYALEPMSRQWVFVDAENGDVIHTLNQIHDGDAEGTADTRYHGIRTIYTDSLDSDLYRLRQTVTGGGIETYDMNEGTTYANAVDFLDSNNYWDNYNAEQDEVATDAHWGARVTYEYFFDEHGRDSYDDQGSKLVSFVHFDQNYVNAFWNGQFMTYGDGNGSFGPLTALDVVAHEISHGVTGNSAGLIYRSESGALNESFSDIFGAAVEWFNDSLDGDWIIGEEMNSVGLRDMSDPKPYGDPDTYRGQNWGYGVFIDNGYVHSNSGVQNYWFYLLTDGGSDVNDLGDEYVVNSIGLVKAGNIAYRNLNVYLTSTSDHQDARLGSLQAARDLYGSCSQEEIEVANAWYAVGVGETFNENDLALEEIVIDDFICGASQEDVSLLIKNISCSNSIPAGDTINVSFSVNGGSVISESIVLSSALTPGAAFQYVFQNKADLSMQGVNLLSAGIQYKKDSVDYNDSLFAVEVENRPIQNTDFGIVDVLEPIANCSLADTADVTLKLFFNGCDSITAGTILNFDLKLDGVTQNASYTLQQNLFTLDTIVITLSDALFIGKDGLLQLDVSLDNVSDPNPDNDAFNRYRFTNVYPYQGDTLGFEDFSFRDTLRIYEAEEARAGREITASNTGLFGLQFSGGNATEYPEGIEFPLPGNVWSINPAFYSEACACVDASQMLALTLNFDLRQQYSEIYRQVLRQPLPYASAFRVSIDGAPITSTYTANSPSSDPWVTKSLNLDQYAGQEFELCFEAKALMWRGFNQITGDADLVQVDNIHFDADFIGTEEYSSPKASGFSIYPNPSSGEFYLAYSAEANARVEYRLTDLSGKLILQNSELLRPGSRLKITEKLAAGSYIFRWSANGKSFVEKVIIR